MTVHRARKSVQVWQTVAVLLLVTLCSSGAPELFIDENWNRSPSEFHSWCLGITDNSVLKCTEAAD
ncbi:MAG: hypothetical protein QF844_05465 [Acidimicrobiales bacterium]|nr:hypothetical protein [Acidimicrobiales bacterium]